MNNPFNRPPNAMTSTEDPNNQDPIDEENEAVSEALAAARAHQRKGRVRETANIFKCFVYYRQSDNCID